MNLLFLDSVDRGTFGGYENWIVLVAKHFAGRDHQVTVVGRPGSEYLRRTKAACDKIETIGLPISGDFNPLTISRLREILAERRVDLMTVNFNKDVRLGGLAARWHGTTRVCWRIGLDITSDRWIHRWLTPKLVDGVIVPSQALKRQVTRHGYLADGIVKVIYNGTEDKRFVRSDPESARLLRDKYHLGPGTLVAVVVGRFVEQKGHRYLVEAAPEIVRQAPNIVFLLLGDGRLEESLRTRIAELGLTRNFVFAGMLDNIDLELAGSDLMVHPAIEEPFSHAILEGMRAGLPIVASQVGGIPEALIEGATGCLVPARDPVKLAATVVKLLKSEATRTTFGQVAQERWRKHFRIDTMMQQVEEYFMTLIGRGVAA
jgi:glycosyltransferase involved in cell wall biosynthesis